MNIIQRFLPIGHKLRPAIKIKPTFITVHNTANTSDGAGAETHARYLENGAGGRTVSWHFTVDDKSIYQHLPLNELGYHAGTTEGNTKSIGIEICENVDGDFQKARANAIWLIRKLMKDLNIPLVNVVPHKHWSGKHCPRLLLDQWTQFIADIRHEEVKPVEPVSKPQDSFTTVPEWARAAMKKAYEKKVVSDVNGSHDFYRFMVVLDKLGLFDK